MILLAHCDASLFTVLFNHVDRQEARACARRLIENVVPCAGAIFNGVPSTGVNYRYSAYYERPEEPVPNKLPTPA